MKKIKQKIYDLIVVIVTFCCVVSMIGCNDKLTIKQDYNFEITHLPYSSKDVEFGQQVEIRFQIRSIGGEYSGTTYYLRYFQFEGKGFLTDEDARMFFPNDLYELSNKAFRLYYQPESGESHILTLTFLDSFGHEKETTLTFTTPQETQ